MEKSGKQKPNIIHYIDVAKSCRTFSYEPGPDVRRPVAKTVLQLFYVRGLRGGALRFVVFGTQESPEFEFAEYPLQTVFPLLVVPAVRRVQFATCDRTNNSNIKKK